MENTNNVEDLYRAVARRLPAEPRPTVRTAHAPRRRPRWLGGRSL